MVHVTSRNILKFEDSIYGWPIRKCGIFDSKGSKLWEDQENFYKFTFPNIVHKNMKGKILTYNEAGEVDTLFAKDMIELAITVQLKELRVVSESGTYSLMPTSPSWPTYNTIIDTFYSTDLDDRLLHKKFLTGECVNIWEEKHNIWGNVAKKIGLKYQRFPPKSQLISSCEDVLNE